MTTLSLPAARALDAAIISLAAFHVVDWLLRCRTQTADLCDVARAAGLPLAEVGRAVDALCARGVLRLDGGQVAIAEAYQPGLVAAWRRLAVDGPLRRRVLGTAAERESRSVTLWVTWAPGAGSAPAWRAPSRFAGPAAPVA